MKIDFHWVEEDQQYLVHAGTNPDVLATVIFRQHGIWPIIRWHVPMPHASPRDPLNTIDEAKTFVESKLRLFFKHCTTVRNREGC